MKRRLAAQTERALGEHHHIPVGWNQVLDTCTLRQDAELLYTLAHAVPPIGRTLLRADDALTNYFIEKFDQVCEGDLFYANYRGGGLHQVGLPALILHLPGHARVENWAVDGKLHRDDGKPAVRLVNWDRSRRYEWWVRGQRHRDGGLPAIYGVAQGEDGDFHAFREWWVHGQRHRDGDLPASEGVDGSKAWFRHGRPSRADDREPVFEHANGTCVYCKAASTFEVVHCP